MRFAYLRVLLLRAITALFPLVCLAQEQGYRVETIAAGDGVAETSVRCVMQDRSGFIWLGTRFGLEKYDGHGFRSYRYNPFDTTTISDYGVSALAEDSGGGIWSGTITGGLSRLDRRTGRSVRMRAGGANAAGLADDRITTLAGDRSSRMWIGTLGGLHAFDLRTNLFDRYDGNRHRGLPEGFPHSVFVDSRHRVWITTCRPSGDSKNPVNRLYISSYDAARDAFDTWPVDSGAGAIRILGESSDGILQLAWMEVDDPHKAMLYRFDPRTSRTERLDLPDRQRDGNAPTVLPLLVDDQGELWFATMAGDGPAALVAAPCTVSRRPVIPFNVLNRGRSVARSQRHTSIETVIAGMPKMAFRDRAGTIWVATREGVVKFTLSGTGITTWRHSDADTTSLSARRVRSIQVDRRGALWVGTDLGLNRLDRGSRGWTHYFYQTPRSGKLRHGTVNVIYDDPHGSLLFGTNNGLLAYDYGSDRFVDPLPLLRREGRSHIMVWSLLRDRSGRLWVGTSLDGLAVFDSTGALLDWYHHDPKDRQSIAGGGIWCMLQDRAGEIWIGTDEGLCRWEPASNRFTRYTHQPGDPSSLGGSRVWGLHEDSGGALWIASFGGGLSRFNRGTNDFTTLTREQGLVDNGVFGILEDDLGHFWISTSRGLVRWNRRTNTFRLFGEEQGLQSSEFSYKAYFKANDGTLYFGGVDGLSAFRPADLRLERKAGSLCITAFTVFDSLVANELFDGDTVRLAHTQNFFSFEFTTLDFVDAHNVRYSYMLEGTDPTWVQTASSRRVAAYTDLEPGMYTFRVRGSNSDGIWTGQELSVTVVIDPPWWATLWFRVSATAAATLLLVGTIRLRIRGVRESERERQQSALQAALESQEAERQRIARDLHDGVGQMLAAAGINVSRAREMIRRDAGRDDASIDASLERSLTILTQVSSDVRTISHALGTSTLRELGLAAALRELLDNFGPQHRTRFEFETVGLGERLPEHQETGLFRVAQELIANVLRHADATEATVQIVREGNEVRMTVEDDGVGFDVARMNGGMGRRNIEGRVSAMGGRVTYDTTPGHGTTVVVAVTTPGPENKRS